MQRQDYDLQRFKNAQEQSYAGYQEALQEIRNGCKVGHWIWYIFPQVKGTGQKQYVGLLWSAGAAGGGSVYGRSVAERTSDRDHDSASSSRGQECGRNSWRY